MLHRFRSLFLVAGTISVGVLATAENSVSTANSLSKSGGERLGAPKRSDPQTDGESTGAAARDACASSLSPGGPYSSYEGALEVCRHGNFLTSYLLDLKAPSWSAYTISPDNVNHELGGRRRFKSDPAIPEEHQEPLFSKCWGEEWNRGHLCPSYIMSWDKEAEGHWDDTYYITNTAMQYGPFNQQTWVHLEKHVVSWIQKNNKPIFIVTGTWFQNLTTSSTFSVSTNGITPTTPAKSATPFAYTGVTKCDLENGDFVDPGKVAPESWMGVPDYYYKLLCDASLGKSIAYFGHNRKDDGVHEMTVVELEAKIGLHLLDAKTCGTGDMDKGYWFSEDLRQAVRGEIQAPGRVGEAGDLIYA